MKKNFTEKEINTDNHLQIYRLARLAEKDQALFHQICDLVPFSVYVNRREDFVITVANQLSVRWMELSLEEMGNLNWVDYVKKISAPDVLEMAINTIRKFESREDRHSLCSYFQHLKIAGKMSWTLTYKTFVSEDFFFNVSHELREFGKAGLHLEKLLGETLIRKDGWARFCTLTKREKQILQMIAEGYTNEEIGERLFTSKFTVKTHRRNLMNKIGARNIREVIHFVQTFEMTGQI